MNQQLTNEEKGLILKMFEDLFEGVEHLAQAIKFNQMGNREDSYTKIGHFYHKLETYENSLRRLRSLFR